METPDSPERVWRWGVAYRINCGAGRAAVKSALLSTTILGGLCLGVPAANAVDGMWLPAPATADWNTGTNWSSSPTVPDNTASFGASATTSLTFSATTTNINTLQFGAGAPAYTFTINQVVAGQTLNISGTGIVNNSSFAPTFTISGINAPVIGVLNFNNSSTAGNAIINNSGGLVSFNNTSSAGTANITNSVFLQFINSSTAGNSTIVSSGNVGFADLSTAGNANITIGVGGSGSLGFLGSATAGNATITTNFNSGGPAATLFLQTSSGGNARFITNAGGGVDFSLLTTAGTTAGSIEGAGNYFLGSKNLTVGSNNLSTTVSGVVSDCGTGGTQCFNSGATGGSLIKVGSGTLTLAGNNTYTGGTALNAGTLAVGSNTALGTGALTFANGTTLQAAANGLSLANAMTLNGTDTVDTQSNSLGLSGTISGTGGLTKIGAGTLTLSAGNTYLGGTTINAGTLAVSSEGNLGNSSGSLAFAGGTLQFLSGFTTNRAVTLNSGGGTFDTNGNNATLAGSISGAGGLTKIGAGTLTLSGANPYSGATAVNAGTLAAGATNTFSSSSAFTVASGATLNLAGFNQTVGSLAGAGNVTLGSATLTPGNDNTSTTFSGTISGTGGLGKIGTGTLTLSGTSSYSGATAVSGGTLIVNGSIANSAVTVNNGATLAGTGTVGATTIRSGGTFAPGNSPGTMTVQGNLAFQSGAIYLVQVNPATASSANVTAGGSASLAGTVQAAFAAGSYVTRGYTIVSAAGGLNGTTFNALSTSNLPAGFTANLSYTANAALLNLTATLAQPNGPSALGAAGFNVNQLNVANALNGFFNNGGALPPNFVSVFGLTGGNLANALTALSGEVATGAQQAGFQLSDQFLSLMLDPFVDGRSGVAGMGGPALGFAPEQEQLPDVALAYSSVLKAAPKPAPVYEPRWTVWGAGFGGSNRTSGDVAVVGSHDRSASVAGFAGGFDYRVTPDTVVGIALAGAGTGWSLAQGLGTGKSDAFQAGLYGATRWGAAYLAAAFDYGNHWMSTDRFAFASDHLTASFNAQSLGGRLEGGYRFAALYGGLTPYAAIQSQSFHTPGYNETDTNGGGFALSYNERTATDTRSELGARFDRALALYSNAVLSFRGRLAWAHDWVSDPTLAAAFQALPGTSFLVNGATPAKDSALTTAGAEYRLANGVTLLGKFDGGFASHSSTYAGTGTLRYAW
jgi:outer membrane autotransporter protein